MSSRQTNLSMTTPKRNFVFTLNNYTNEEYATLQDLPNKYAIKWMIIGKEVGESGEDTSKIF